MNERKQKQNTSNRRRTIDMDDAQPVWDYCMVPEGIYACSVDEVRLGLTRAGDEKWSIKFVVAEGNHAGKFAAWDALVFNERCKGRVGLILTALGLPNTGKVTIGPGDLEGRTAVIKLFAKEYISYAGYRIRRHDVFYSQHYVAAAEAEAVEDHVAAAEAEAAEVAR